MFDEIVTEDVIQVMLEEDDIYVLSITAFIDDVDGIRWNSSTTSKIFVWKLANGDYIFPLFLFCQLDIIRFVEF